MIRKCSSDDFETMYDIINDSARAYKGVISADRWCDPYMSRDHLKHEMDAGVVFLGYDTDSDLVGVMGAQDVQDVTLIRHAYVRTTHRRHGIGGKLIAHLKMLITCPSLIGTWAAATWAVRFYEKHGFRLVTHAEKERLLRKYWSIPERQTETSVVLADQKWFDASGCGNQ
jgi:N-acetylglutamate synthase-like GNAT family acetyltransferase